MPTREEIDAAKARILALPPEQQSQLLQQTQTGGPGRDEIEAAKARIRNLPPEEQQKLLFGVEEEKGFLQSAGEGILSGAQAVGEAFERFSGAPTRSAVRELVRPDDQFSSLPTDTAAGRFGQQVVRGVTGGASAFIPGLEERGARAGEAFTRQFGSDPEQAPTTKDIASDQLGISTEENVPVGRALLATPVGTAFLAADQLLDKFDVDLGAEDIAKIKVSPAGAVGFIGDMTLDISNAIPIGSAFKLAGKGIAKGARGAKIGATALSNKVGLGEAVKIAEDFARGHQDARKAIFNAKISKDFENFKQVAKSIDLDIDDIEALKFGSGSTLETLGRAKRQAIGGETAREIFNAKLQKVQQSVLDLPQQISGGRMPKSYEEAGKTLMSGLFDARQKFWATVDSGYNKIAQLNPDLTLSNSANENIMQEISKIETIASRLIKSRATRARGQKLMGFVDDFLDTGGGFQNTTDFLRNVREVGLSAKGVEDFIPADISALRDLTKVVRKSLIDTVGSKISKEAADNLVTANKKMQRFFGTNAPINKQINAVIDGRMSPDQFYKSLVKNGTSDQIASVKNLLTGTDTLKQIQGFALDDLIIRNPSGSSLDFSIANTLTKLKNRNTYEKLANLVEPEQMQVFGARLNLGHNFGPAILNPPNTGLLNILAGGVRNALKVSGGLEVMLQAGKRHAWRKAVKEAAGPKPKGPLFGPQAISLPEAVGIRLPQQINTQERNQGR